MPPGLVVQGAVAVGGHEPVQVKGQPEQATKVVAFQVTLVAGMDKAARESRRESVE